MIGAMDAQAVLGRSTGAPAARAAAALHRRPAQAHIAARRQPRSRARAVAVTAAADMPTVGIIYYSTYGHVRILAQKVKEGVEAAGCTAELYQVNELLPAEVLEKMGAPPKSDDPIIEVGDLPKFDGLLFGMPTRFGNMPFQMKALFDATGQLWKEGALVGKPAGVFVTTATQGGGAESTALATYAQLAPHGCIIVPQGYTFQPMGDNAEMHGGTPYGCGTVVNLDGSRMPSQLELDMAVHQGKYFAGVVKRLGANPAA